MSDIGDLVRLAGRRPEPPEFRTARVRTAVEAEWRQLVRRRSRWAVWRWGVAAAAVLAVAVWLRPVLFPLPAPSVEVATVARVEGDARVADRKLSAGDRVLTGAALDTTDGGRLVLQLDEGVVVRVKDGSRLFVETPSQLRLVAGTIYVDTHAGASTQRIEVRTVFGTIHNHGTQFEVSLAPASLRVRVRDGEVRVERSGNDVRVPKAEAVTIRPGHEVERRAVPISGTEWSWVEDAAPQFVLEGATLESFLNWVSRELGATWRFADPAAERHGKAVILHGSIDGLTATDALSAVLPTCGMTHRLRRNQLVVALASR